jgi:L-aminopeptidase/D-esterase-like protein
MALEETPNTGSVPSQRNEIVTNEAHARRSCCGGRYVSAEQHAANLRSLSWPTLLMISTTAAMHSREKIAGRGAWCGSVMDPARAEPSGQGGAFREKGPTKVAVFCVVNAAGVNLDRQGQVVRGNRDPQSGLRTHPLRDLGPTSDPGPEPDAMPGRDVSDHTTLTVVVTNQQLSSSSLQQFARQVHTSLARGIYPFHTGRDGDVCYAITTNEVENPGLSEIRLGMFAAEVAWDALLSF